jgi:hypothetical protein
MTSGPLPPIGWRGGRAARGCLVQGRTGTWDQRRSDDGAIDLGAPGREYPPMHIATRVPASARARRPGSSVAAVAGLTVAGIAWLGIAGASGWLVFATPMLKHLVVVESRSGGAILGAVVWALALTAPACCAILGVARLAGATRRYRGGSRSVPPVARRAAMLPPGCSVIPRVHLPDGHRIPDVVVGPHGVALFEPLPPAAPPRGGRGPGRLIDLHG